MFPGQSGTSGIERKCDMNVLPKVVALCNLHAPLFEIAELHATLLPATAYVVSFILRLIVSRRAHSVHRVLYVIAHLPAKSFVVRIKCGVI